MGPGPSLNNNVHLRQRTMSENSVNLLGLNTPKSNMEDPLAQPDRFPVQRKTRMCKFYVLGHCMQGRDCMYAHGMDELKQKPDFDRRQLLELCPCLLQTGYCTDPRCDFVHNKEQFQKRSGNFASLPLTTEQCHQIESDSSNFSDSGGLETYAKFKQMPDDFSRAARASTEAITHPDKSAAMHVERLLRMSQPEFYDD